MQADALTTLTAWLDFYRATLIGKVEGLTGEQVREASVPPSSLTLLGLVRHLASVERNWFRQVLGGEDVPLLYPREPGTGHDGGFELRSADLPRPARPGRPRSPGPAGSSRRPGRTAPGPSVGTRCRWCGS